MEQSQNRVTPNHLGPGEAHYLSHFLAHIQFVTVGPACRASCFVLSVGATLQAICGVIQEFRAGLAQLTASMLPAAINPYHAGNGSLFPFDS
jgi:hypothetical protein